MKFNYQRFALGAHDSRKSLVARPFVPVHLVGNGMKTRSPYFALLDSGADRVLLPGDLAAEVGITGTAATRPSPLVQTVVSR